jgi:hypothetical protein
MKNQVLFKDGYSYAETPTLIRLSASFAISNATAYPYSERVREYEVPVSLVAINPIEILRKFIFLA